jgi:UDPglucose 6-dehydrogenase
MKICVIGTGYVGLVVGTGFAEYGNDVICVDIDEEKIEKLKKAEIPIYEPGLAELVKRNFREKRLYFSCDLKDAVQKSKIVFIAVDTPSMEDGNADLTNVLKVVEGIAAAMNDYKVIVNKSTVPVGTAEYLTGKLKDLTKHDFDFVSNPEFLKEGMAVADFLRPERIIVGVESNRAKDVMEELYVPFVANGNPIYYMKVKSAEMAKYASNSFLATKISFANEIANLCDLLGAVYSEVRIGMGSDSRIGKKFLYAGTGYGGSCFPKDVRALLKTAQKNDMDLKILSQVEAVNNSQKSILIRKIIEHFGSLDKIKGMKFALWGLAFKPGTDDMREAPSIPIVKALSDAEVKIYAFDPVAIETSRAVFGNLIEYEHVDNYKILEQADALLIITEWPQFRRPNFEKIKKLMKTSLIFDGRNIFKPKLMKKLKIKYYSIGNGRI